jgi:hypothetical protein
MTKEEALRVLLKMREWRVWGRGEQSEENRPEMPKQKEVDEAFDVCIEILSRFSLPSNLEEAAGKYLERPENNSANQWEDLMIYGAFIDGAKWMAEQGVSYQDIISADKTIPVLPMKDVSDMGLDYGDKVIVQIRKKD